MSQTSFGIGKGTRSRTGSAIAQALVNVANVAGVSSGRKISSSASALKVLSEADTVSDSKEDLPPTYSTVTANKAVTNVNNDESSGDKKNSVDLRSQEYGSIKCNEVRETVGTETGITCDVKSSHPSHQLGSEAMGDGMAELENTSQSVEHLLSSCRHSLEDIEPTTNGVLSESPTGKSKKRLSWFGKRQDSTTESESSSAAESNEEETRRKVRWLWRSAVHKSKAQRNTASKLADDVPNATSLEKLKSG